MNIDLLFFSVILITVPLYHEFYYLYYFLRWSSLVLAFK